MLQRVLSLFWKHPQEDTKEVRKEPVNVNILIIDERFKKINEKIPLTKVFHPDHVYKCQHVDLLSIGTEITQEQKFKGQLYKSQTETMAIYKDFESFVPKGSNRALETLKQKLDEWSPQQPLTILAIRCVSEPDPDHCPTVHVKLFRFQPLSTKEAKLDQVTLRLFVVASMLEDPKKVQLINKYVFRDWPDNKQHDIGFQFRMLFKDKNNTEQDIEKCTQRLDSLFL